MGIDIDESLIRCARKNIRHYATAQTKYVYLIGFKNIIFVKSIFLLFILSQRNNCMCFSSVNCLEVSRSRLGVVEFELIKKTAIGRNVVRESVLMWDW